MESLERKEQATAVAAAAAASALQQYCCVHPTYDLLHGMTAACGRVVDLHLLDLHTHKLEKPLVGRAGVVSMAHYTETKCWCEDMV